jgi:hypothetical protein
MIYLRRGWTFLKREFESFGLELISSKFIQAVNGYWDLIQHTDNDRVKGEGYRYFIDRKLGKPTKPSMRLKQDISPLITWIKTYLKPSLISGKRIMMVYNHSLI